MKFPKSLVLKILSSKLFGSASFFFSPLTVITVFSPINFGLFILVPTFPGNSTLISKIFPFLKQLYWGSKPLNLKVWSPISSITHFFKESFLDSFNLIVLSFKLSSVELKSFNSIFWSKYLLELSENIFFIFSIISNFSVFQAL